MQTEINSASLVGHHSDLTGGYGREALTAAFNKVANQKHWKDAIDACIPESEFAITREAVIFFTGSVLEVVEHLEGGQLRVRADGYWAAIGA